MTTKTVSNYITAAVLWLIAALAIANWYLRPGRAAAWATIVVLAGCVFMALVASQRLKDVSGWKSESSIQGGIVIAGVFLVIALSSKLAAAFGLNNQTDLGWRATMATAGAFLMIRGNAMPKKVTPLSRFGSDAARVQTMRRFTGWIWVLTGLALMVPWLVLSTALANTVTFFLLPSAILVTLIQCFRLRGAQESAV